MNKVTKTEVMEFVEPTVLSMVAEPLTFRLCRCRGIRTDTALQKVTLDRMVKVAKVVAQCYPPAPEDGSGVMSVAATTVVPFLPRDHTERTMDHLDPTRACVGFLARKGFV